MRTVLTVATLACTAIACGGGSTPTSPSAPSSTSTPASNDTPPVLSAAFVAADQAVAFFVFGARLPSGVENPTYEIETVDQAPSVFASASGSIVAIETTSQGDSAITIVTSANSAWSVIHDHVNNVAVTRGQTVAAGTRLGTVGRLGNGRGRTELQVNRIAPAPTLAYCPQAYGTAAFNDVFAAVSLRVNGHANVCAATTVRP